MRKHLIFLRKADFKAYELFSLHYLFLILVPEWTAWSSTKCSTTCGAGTIVRTRKCEDYNTGKELDKNFDCGNDVKESDYKQIVKCENKPCAGKFENKIISPQRLGIFQKCKVNCCNLKGFKATILESLSALRFDLRTSV